MCDTSGMSGASTIGRIATVSYRPSKVDDVADTFRLRPIDSVDLTIIVDNTIDALLVSSKQVHRETFAPGWSKRPKPVAEHGYSILFSFHKKGVERNILYDAGLTPETILHNVDTLGIQLENLDAIVLSHGHTDHHGGLLALIRKLGKRKLPLIFHPDAWRNRKVVLPSGAEVELPPPDQRALEREDVQLLEERGHSMLMDDEALVTGQVKRTTDFEKGFKNQYAEENGKWEPDPWVWDDQGIICNINGKGLVVVSSCSHSGAINILRNARQITGVEKVHAFVGGLHLPAAFEPIIPQTVKEFETIHPDVIVPGHCTGWKATHEIARRLPDSFVQSSVGTRIHFG